MYAVIKVGGKQYRVSEGDEIFVEKLNANEMLMQVMLLLLKKF